LKGKAFLGFILLCSLSVVNVSANTISGISLDVFPTSGDITTTIFVRVRGTPYNGIYKDADNNYPVLYVFFDDKVIMQREVPLIYPRTYYDSYYDAAWDVEIKVPNEFPYSNLGVHEIRVRVEANDGTSATAKTTFNVVNYIQPPEWWRDLPSEFLDTIRGPTGPKGATGAQGPKGDPGVSAPVEYFYASIGISVVAIIIALVAITRRR